MRTKTMIGSHSQLLGLEAGEDHAADADEEGEDAEPPVGGDRGAFGDVDAGSVVADGGGRWCWCRGDAHGVLLRH